MDMKMITHFNACTKYDKVIHSPSAGISPSKATRIVCVSFPSCATVEEATSCSFESRILKEKKNNTFSRNALFLFDRKTWKQVYQRRFQRKSETPNKR